MGTGMISNKSLFCFLDTARHKNGWVQLKGSMLTCIEDNCWIVFRDGLLSLPPTDPIIVVISDDVQTVVVINNWKIIIQRVSEEADVNYKPFPSVSQVLTGKFHYFIHMPSPSTKLVCNGLSCIPAFNKSDKKLCNLLPLLVPDHLMNRTMAKKEQFKRINEKRAYFESLKASSVVAVDHQQHDEAEQQEEEVKTITQNISFFIRLEYEFQSILT